MGVFGAVFGRRGDGGFNGPLLRASSGVVGFNVAVFLSPVREVFRPARPGVDESAKKFAQHTKNGSKWAFYGALGELLRGNAAGGPCGASFFAGELREGLCWASFFAELLWNGRAGRLISRKSCRPSWCACGVSAVLVGTAYRRGPKQHAIPFKALRVTNLNR